MLIEPMTYRLFYIHRVFSIVFKLFPFIAIISPNINSERLMLKAVHTKKCNYYHTTERTQVHRCPCTTKKQNATVDVGRQCLTPGRVKKG